MCTEWIGFFIVIETTIVKVIEIFHENLFQQVQVENEIYRLGEDVKATQDVFVSEVSVDFVDFLDEMHGDSDLPEVPQRENRCWCQHSFVTEVRIAFLDVSK